MPQTTARLTLAYAAVRQLRTRLARLSVISGLLSCEFPRVAIAIVAILSLIMSIGAAKLENDDALGSLLRSNTADYADYEAFKRVFPANEYDLLIALSWRGPFDALKAEALRSIHLEEQLQDGIVEGVTSIFSLRDPPQGEEVPPPVIPETLPAGEAFRDLMAKVQANPLVDGRLLSLTEEGGLALVVVSLKGKAVAADGLVPVVRSVEDIARTLAAPAGLTAGITGIPVMKAEIVEASGRDRVLFPVLGFLVGLAVCFYFFRDWRYVVVCVFPSSLAVLWALGLFGFLGLELDPVKNAILPLVMVVALTDTLHISIAAKVAYAEGASKTEAARRAVRESGTACALTAATTAIAFFSMNLTDSDLISGFGTAAAFATLLEYALVISCVPALFVLLVGERRGGEDAADWQDTRALAALGRLTRSLSRIVVAHHKPIALWGIAAMALFAVLHLNVPSYYRLSDLVPQRQQAARTADDLEARFGGIYPVSVVISWSPDTGIGSQHVLDTIARVHAVMAQTKGVTKVLSLDTLRLWLGGETPATPERLTAFIDKAPPEISARFIDKKRQKALVTGYIGDLHASEVMAIAADLRARLAPIAAANPGLVITVSDLSVMAASRSLSIIGQLNDSLLSTILVDLPTIGFAFGSLAIVAYGAIANIFAVVAMGALLYLFSPGVQYASIIALTVTFGLTADGTIHFLNRVRLERERGTATREAVGEAVAHVGAVLALSTIILLLGLAVTLASAVPPTRMFGQTCSLTLILSLPGLLVLMPAVMLLLWREREEAIPEAVHAASQSVAADTAARKA